MGELHRGHSTNPGRGGVLTSSETNGCAAFIVACAVLRCLNKSISKMRMRMLEKPPYARSAMCQGKPGMIRSDGTHSGNRKLTSLASFAGLVNETVAGLVVISGQGAGSADGASDVGGAREVWEFRTHAEKGDFLTRTQSPFVSTIDTGVPVVSLTTASPKGVLVERRADSRKVISWWLS